jgi:hypothetical protein
MDCNQRDFPPVTVHFYLSTLMRDTDNNQADGSFWGNNSTIGSAGVIF